MHSGLGSGLNTLSDFPFIEDERVTWDDCNLNDGDCLTPKGFSFLRLRVSDGLWVDLYNLHTDAGSDSGDRAARASNFGQVADFMSTWSAGMPVIVMGDTNSRYTDSTDGATLRSFVSTTGTTDSWVRNVRSGSPPAAGSTALVCPFPFASGTSQATMNACETVDKFFVRGSTAITLTPTAFTNQNNAFVNSSGYPLSDHYPLSSTITWTLSSSVRLADPVGGPHGTVYNDIPSLITGKSVPKITSITIRAGDRVDAVSYSVVYPSGSTATASHGGTGGTATTLTLALLRIPLIFLSRSYLLSSLLYLIDHTPILSYLIDTATTRVHGTSNTHYRMTTAQPNTRLRHWLRTDTSTNTAGQLTTTQ